MAVKGGRTKVYRSGDPRPGPRVLFLPHQYVVSLRRLQETAYFDNNKESGATAPAIDHGPWLSVAACTRKYKI
jgi:hypothetical protein